jgi:hypothetical protein
MFITSLIYEKRYFSRVLLWYTDFPLTQLQVLRARDPSNDWTNVKRKLKINKALVLLHVNVRSIFLANISHFSATLNTWYSELSRRSLSPQCAVFLTYISNWKLLHILQTPSTFQLEVSTYLTITLWYLPLHHLWDIVLYLSVSHILSTVTSLIRVFFIAVSKMYFTSWFSLNRQIRNTWTHFRSSRKYLMVFRVFIPLCYVLQQFVTFLK